MIDVSKVLNEKYVVISVVGDHAGEKEKRIFRRKCASIDRAGKTFWVVHSTKASPTIIQKFCKRSKKTGRECYCLLIKASSKSAAKDTKKEIRAKMYSEIKPTEKSWKKLPKEIGKVTGKLDNIACGFVFKELEKMKNKEIDLWEYAELDTSDPILFSLGNSTVCAIKKNTSHCTKKMKSHNREIIAIAKLCKPYGVWLK